MRRLKSDLAVFALVVRTSIYKVLGLLVLMAAVQLALFGAVVSRQLEQETISRDLEWASQDPEAAGGHLEIFESLLESCGVPIVFFAAFLLVCMVMAWADSDRKGCRTTYLLGRLNVGRTKLFAPRTVYHMGCLVLLFGVQIGLVLVMYGAYERLQNPEYLSPQALFLAFYRSDFLHSLVPMEETVRWVRNAFLILAGSMEISFWNGTPGNAKRRMLLVIWVLFTILTFSNAIGNIWSDVWVIILNVFCMVITTAEVLGFWGRDIYDK